MNYFNKVDVMLCIWLNIKRNVVYLTWLINKKIRFKAE